MNKIISCVKVIYHKLVEFINKGQNRTVLAKKNVVGSLLIRGVDTSIAFLLVPLVLGYLDETRYGIWLTMTSIVAWFGYLDVGLGHGLRVKFAEAVAAQNHNKARTYVSTAYAIITSIIVMFIFLFGILNRFLPWDQILNVKQQLSSDLSTLSYIVFGFFSLNFVAKLITTLVVADQKPAIRDAINLMGKLLIIVVIYVLTLTTKGSLIYLGLAYSALPVMVVIAASIYLFNTRYKKYRPSYEYIDFAYAKDLIGLGWKFFIIQIALVVIMSTDNVIISQLYSPELVTPYQIANKYFTLVLMTFTVIVTPLWSATSEALVKKDFQWIKASVGKLNKIALLFTFLSIIMLAFSKQIYTFWVGEDIKISYLLSFLWMLFVVIGMFNGIYFSVINGAGKIKLATFVYTFAMIINIPLSIYFAKHLQMGIEGIILATVICQSMHLVYLPFQYMNLVSRDD